MPELARKFEQPLATEEQRNPVPDASRRYGAGAETEEPRTETVKERERREYEEFWNGIREYDERGYDIYWDSESRKAYLEQGVEFLVDAYEKGADTMVFMDKRARPLAGFFRAIWRRTYPNQDPPAMRFLVSRPEAVMDYERQPVTVNPSQVRQIFVKSKSVFKNKRVLLVDEEVWSGRTLKEAEKILKSAFPDIGETLLGAIEVIDASEASNLKLDVGPIESHRGNYRNLSGVLVMTGGDAGASEVEEDGASPVVVAKKGIDRTLTTSYRLRQIGKHEILDDKSLQGIDKEIKEAKNDKERERLLRIREAYEQLMKT